MDSAHLLSSRRHFLEFMGRTIGAAPFIAPLLNSSCALQPLPVPSSLPFRPLKASAKDEVIFTQGFSYKRLMTWGDPINAQGDRFGTNNDYIAFVPLSERDPSDGLLWVNHENMEPKFVSDYYGSAKRTREQVDLEQRSVGGSILRVRRSSLGEWEVIANDSYNRRLSAKTPIPLIAPRPIAGRQQAIGTLGNCAGGITPWNTVLTCEENYQDFYGEADYSSGKRKKLNSEMYGWDAFYDYPPEHYGWVVEVNPFTGKARKLTALGRFAHEGATVVRLGDGRCVVYMGDDASDQCIYKFVSSQPNNLDKGELFVADLTAGRWRSLSFQKQPILRQKFRDQTDVLIRAREAARFVGGTPCDRPEDIEVDPLTGQIFVTLTNNKRKKNFFGSILKITERGNQYAGTEFQAETFLAGGETTGFACPDNLAFDRKGNLWIATDITGGEMNQTPYKAFGNNSLFYIPMSGSDAGKAFRVASAPVDAEFTGPCFSLDGRTLFLSVQHPGEKSLLPGGLTSHWPHGGREIPRSAVIAVEGQALNSLLTG